MSLEESFKIWIFQLKKGLQTRRNKLWKFMFMNVSVLRRQDLWVLCFNRIYETGIQLKSNWITSCYILRHQTVQYPAVKDNADLEFLNTPKCRVRNFSYEFAVISKNKILRDFWETQSLKNGLNRQFWKKIARLCLRHLRFESLYLCHHLGTFVFRGFFMPKYCFLWRYSGTFSLPQNLVRVFERF